MQSAPCYEGLRRQTQHHFGKFLIMKWLDAPGQLEMQIMFVWFTDIGDSFLPAQDRSSHLLNWVSCEDTQSELQSPENFRDKWRLSRYTMHKRKRKYILEEELGSTRDLHLYLTLPSLQNPPLIHLFSFICLVYIDAEASKVV